MLLLMAMSVDCFLNLYCFLAKLLNCICLFPMICDNINVYVFPAFCLLLEEASQSMIDRFQFANRSIL